MLRSLSVSSAGAHVVVYGAIISMLAVVSLHTQNIAASFRLYDAIRLAVKSDAFLYRVSGKFDQFVQ